MQDEPEVVVILQPGVELDDLQAFLDGQEWNYEDEYPANDEAPYHIVWVTLDRRTRIRYVDDDVIGERYLFFSGRDAAAFGLATQHALDCWTLADCHAALSALDSGDRASWLIRAALCARTVDAHLLSWLEQASCADDPALRDAAITAMAYVCWPESIELLRQMAERDPDPSLREDAQLVLETLSGR